MKEYEWILMECEGISVFHNTDHGLAGVEQDLVAVVIVITCGTVIGSLLPVHMNASAVGEKPAVSGGIMTLECQITFTQFFIKSILHQNIFESQLFAGDSIHVGAIRTAGQVLGTVIETVILVEFEITSGQRITSGHINVSGVLCLGTVLVQSIRLRFGSETEMIIIGETTVFQAVALFVDHRSQTFP